MINKRAFNITVFILFSITTTHVFNETPIIAGFVSSVPETVTTSIGLKSSERPVVGGIKITYSGYSNYTNNDGYFSFPKHHIPQQTDTIIDEIRLIICNDTSYNLLKNTVSKVEVNKKEQKPSLAVYRITKQKESATPSSTPNASATANSMPSASPAPADTSYFFKIESQGTSIPSNGLLSSDLIIHADPTYFYLHPNSTYYAEENNNFILPDNSIYLLKTPPAPELGKDDNLTQSVDAAIEVETIPTKATEPDSMGNPLPEIQRAVIQSH